MEVLVSRLKNPVGADMLLRVWEFLEVLASDRGSEELRRKAVKGGLLGVVKLASSSDDVELKAKIKVDMARLIDEERVPVLREALRVGLQPL